MRPDFNAMTIEELESHIQQLGNVRNQLNAEAREVHLILDERNRQRRYAEIAERGEDFPPAQSIRS